MVNGFDLPQSPQPKPFFKADPLPGEKPEAPAVGALKGSAYEGARNAQRRRDEETSFAESGAAANKARPFARRAAVGAKEQTLLAKQGKSRAYVPNQPSQPETLRAGYTPGPVLRHDVDLKGPAAVLAKKHTEEGITSAKSRVNEFSARYPTVQGQHKEDAVKAHTDLINKHLDVMPAGSALHENHVKNHEHDIWSSAATAQAAGASEQARQAKQASRPGLQVASAGEVKSLFDTIAQKNPTLHPRVIGEMANHKLSENLDLEHAKASQAFSGDTHTHADARRSLILSRVSVRNAHRDMLSGHVENLSNEVLTATRGSQSHPRYEAMVRAAAATPVAVEESRGPSGYAYKGKAEKAAPLGPSLRAATRSKKPVPTAETIAAKPEISKTRSAAVDSFVKAPLSFHFGQGAAK